MYFTIYTLRIIIFATFISNIVTKPDDSLIRFDKHVDTKEHIHDIKLKNNTHDIKLKNNTHITHEEINNNPNNFYIAFGASILCAIFMIILVLKYLFRCCNYRFECDRRFIRRNCLRFSECCGTYIYNLPNDPPAPDRVIIRQPEAADYRDIYEMCNNYIRNLPNDPPPPYVISHQELEAADYRDIYELPDNNYIRNLPNDPPPPYVISHQELEAADYRDIYELPDNNYIRNLPNDPPPPYVISHQELEAADYRDIYELPDDPV